MLTTDPEYKDKIFDLIAAIRKSGSTDLRPQLEPIYGKDLEQFTKDWLRWTAEKIKSNEPGEFQ
jgi:ABC-type Fe3+ transport system substrate-binding protein